jgi:D-amino-acid dehydrogenase
VTGLPDVVVVGGGLIGAACAYELSCRGASVMVVERGPEVACGCSYGSAGLVGPGIALPLASPQALREALRWLGRPRAPLRIPPRPALIPWLARFALACRARSFRRAREALAPLGWESFRMHLAYAQAGLEVGLARRGVLMVWDTEAGLAAGREELRDTGEKATFLGPREAREAEPLLRSPVAGAALVADAAHADSARWTRVVIQAAVAQGAEVRTGVEVRRLVVRSGRTEAVETDQGVIRAGAVVVAAGASSRGLLAGAGVPIPLEAGKGYHLDLEAAVQSKRPVYLRDSHVVATPLGAGRLRLAGTLELSGMETSVDERRTTAILLAADRSLAGVAGLPVREVWAGLRPCTADGMPVIGAVDGIPNLIVATGHAMIGFALAPITGRLVAELAAGQAPTFDLSAFDPGRFGRSRRRRSPAGGVG